MKGHLYAALLKPSEGGIHAINRAGERSSLFPNDNCRLDKVNLKNRQRDTPTYLSSSLAAVSTA